MSVLGSFVEFLACHIGNGARTLTVRVKNTSRQPDDDGLKIVLANWFS